MPLEDRGGVVVIGEHEMRIRRIFASWYLVTPWAYNVLVGRRDVVPVAFLINLRINV